MSHVKTGRTLLAIAVGEERSVLAKSRAATTTEGAAAIAHRLATLRKARGLTQTDVAQAVGLSQALVSKYERGDLLMHSELIVRFAQLLDVSADDILGIQRKRRSSPAAPAPAVDRGLARRFAQVQSLPRRDREALSRTIDVFLAARAAQGHAA